MMEIQARKASWVHADAVQCQYFTKNDFYLIGGPQENMNFSTWNRTGLATEHGKFSFFGNFGYFFIKIVIMVCLSGFLGWIICFFSKNVLQTVIFKAPLLNVGGSEVKN